MERFDVTIDNVDTAANRFDVTETYANVRTGPYRWHRRDPDGPHGGHPQPADPGEWTVLARYALRQRGHLQAVRLDDTFDIVHFAAAAAASAPPLFSPHGRRALRAYEDGDQL